MGAFTRRLRLPETLNADAVEASYANGVLEVRIPVTEQARPLTIWAGGENTMAPSPLDDENAPLYTVGQVAEMLAVKQAFLRRVDDLRVVSPQRSAGGQRRYTRYEIRVIQQVVSMADEGITLQAIRRIIELERRLAAVTRERDELARRLAELLEDD
jgi:DNA-binding transcriptional MerR regulator